MQVDWQLKYIRADKNCEKKTIEFFFGFSIFCDKNKIVI